MSSERQPPPPEPYPYRPSIRYTREQALAEIPSGASTTELCGARFILWQDGVLGFLDVSELRLGTGESLEWCPMEDFRVSEERPTWLPSQLRDGSARACRGVALFIRANQGPYVYAGRAELSNWPIEPTNAQWARFAMEAPVVLEIELPADLEAELDNLAPLLENKGIKADLLRRLATGHSPAWSELMEGVIDQDIDFGALRIVTPFLLKLLRNPSCPFKADILWLLSAAREDSPWASEAAAAAAAGLGLYVDFLGHGDPETRRAAVFAIQTCGRLHFASPLRLRVRQESDERVQASMLTALLVPGDREDLPLFLEILRTSPSSHVKMVAALLAVEASPESLPQEASRCLRQRAWEWSEFESWWNSLDPGGTMPFEPSEVLGKHGFFWDDDQGAHGDLLNTLAGLPKVDLIRVLLPAAEVELYETALNAEDAGGAERAAAVLRDWLKDPTSGLLQEEAREAGSQASRLLIGALATACARMPDLATKTCLDALLALPSELRKHAFARIRGVLE